MWRVLYSVHHFSFVAPQEEFHICGCQHFIYRLLVICLKKNPDVPKWLVTTQSEHFLCFCEQSSIVNNLQYMLLFSFHPPPVSDSHCFSFTLIYTNLNQPEHVISAIPGSGYNKFIWLFSSFKKFVKDQDPSVCVSPEHSSYQESGSSRKVAEVKGNKEGKEGRTHIWIHPHKKSAPAWQQIS